VIKAQNGWSPVGRTKLQRNCDIFQYCFKLKLLTKWKPGLSLKGHACKKSGGKVCVCDVVRIGTSNCRYVLSSISTVRLIDVALQQPRRSLTERIVTVDRSLVPTELRPAGPMVPIAWREVRQPGNLAFNSVVCTWLRCQALCGKVLQSAYGEDIKYKIGDAPVLF